MERAPSGSPGLASALSVQGVNASVADPASQRGRSRSTGNPPPSGPLLDGGPLEAPWWMMRAAARGAAATRSVLEGRASSTCCSSCAAPGSGRAPLRPRAGRVQVSTRDEGSACVAGRHGVLWLASAPCSGQEGTSNGLTTAARIIILGPAAAGRRRFCRVLRRVSGCFSASSGFGRARGCQQLDGEVARVRRGRVADSCLRTHADVCVVCAFASAPRAVCKSGMTTVLKTSSLLLSSRIPIDRVPLGSENIE